MMQDAHAHGTIDQSIFAALRGISVVKRFFLRLIATALFQVALVLLSGSVALKHILPPHSH